MMVFAIVFVRLGYCVASGVRREKEQERILALCVLVVVYYGSNPVRGQACGHVGGDGGAQASQGDIVESWVGDVGEGTKLHNSSP